MDSREKYFDDLRSSVLFIGIPEEVLQKIFKAGRWLEVAKDSFVYRKNDRSGTFYLVARGYVELIAHIVGAPCAIVSQIGPGGHFGEVALLNNSNNSLDARALSDLVLLCYDQELFHFLLLENSILQARLCTALARRLQLSFNFFARIMGESNTKKKSHENSGPTSLAELHPRLLEENAAPGQHTVRKIKGSSLSVQIERAVVRFKDNLLPILLSGEAGTGRRLLAYEIHRGGLQSHGPYIELDLRDLSSSQLDMELFGIEPGESAFFRIDQLGAFDRAVDGTLVLYGAEHMEPDVQRQLEKILRKRKFYRLGGEIEAELRSRIIFICRDDFGKEDGHNRLLPSLFRLVSKQHFRVAPLRAHRRELPQLVQYYLQRYCLQYGKNIQQVDEKTLGMIMNYDWPGNLDEMASVMQRAVILGDNSSLLNSEILLGVPKTEGKWEFNLLRVQAIRDLVMSRFYPVLPRIVVGVFLGILLLVLYLGPQDPKQNLGLVLSWQVGWPLLLFSFFFFARVWCSICGLALPGWLAQRLVKPGRSTPDSIKKYGTWIPGLLCVLLFWVELTWNSSQSPVLTGFILVAIMSGAFIFSLLFERRVWCRYICPLGGLNALFSMSSILELRANSHMCVNHCTDHLCYSGSESTPGCPMFRHPFLVDNNRDCILCGNCVKNCNHQSIHINLRLAPLELWNQRSPRLEDGFLIFSLAGIFYPFVLHEKYPGFLEHWVGFFSEATIYCNHSFIFSLFFFGCIALHLLGYAIFSWLLAHYTATPWKTVLCSMSYGFIPLILAAFMALHFEMFIAGILMVPSLLLNYCGIETELFSGRLLSRDATLVFQGLTMFGGLLASLLATRNIVGKFKVPENIPAGLKLFIALLLLGMAVSNSWLLGIFG